MLVYEVPCDACNLNASYVLSLRGAVTSEACIHKRSEGPVLIPATFGMTDIWRNGGTTLRGPSVDLGDTRPRAPQTGEYLPPPDGDR